jgi:diaminopimelate epimerase
MSSVPFTKMEAVGNDFVLVDGRRLPGLDWPALAVAMCRRRVGIGADGLLVLLPSAVADVRMRMFNPDGTEDHCGNGLRCVSVYYVRHQGTGPTADLLVETNAGTRAAHVFRQDGVPMVRVEMGSPGLHPEEIPARFTGDTVVDRPLDVQGREVRVTSVSVGTAHTVIFAPESAWAGDFEALSPAVEHHQAYPERTSVLWTDASDPSRLRVRIWERGVGETLGCGTGACAVAVAARLRSRDAAFPDAVDVVSAGGTLRVEWDGRGPIYLTGPAHEVYHGEWRQS